MIAGLPIHSISRSDAPGLSGATRAVISIVSVRSSAGKDLARPLNVSFSFPVLAFQVDDDGFRRQAFCASTPAIAVAILSLLILSPSRQSAAAKRMVRSISTMPLVQPAATTPGDDFELCDQRRRRDPDRR